MASTVDPPCAWREESFTCDTTDGSLTQSTSRNSSVSLWGWSPGFSRLKPGLQPQSETLPSKLYGQSSANRRRDGRPSRCVIRVQPDVLLCQVARPEAAAAVAECEAQPHVNLALALQVRARGCGVERLRRAAVVEQQGAQPQRQLVLLEYHAAVARRRHDAAPVWI